MSRNLSLSIIPVTFVMRAENGNKESYEAAASSPCRVPSLGLVFKQLVSVQRCFHVAPYGLELLFFCAHFCCLDEGVWGVCL